MSEGVNIIQNKNLGHLPLAHSAKAAKAAMLTLLLPPLN